MRSLLSAVFILLFHPVSAQETAGLFEGHGDIGHPAIPGSTRYDAGDQSYSMKGAGYNIWFNRDECQYAWKKIRGDFILTANFEFKGEKGNGHRKTGWMVRESPDEAAASMNAVVHGDGLTVLQWREIRGAYMRDPRDEIFCPKRNFPIVQLERKGHLFIMRVAHPGEPLLLVGMHEMPDMPDAVYAGLYICSHDSAASEEVKIWNVRIDKPVENNYSPNPQVKAPELKETMGCRLETMDVFNGIRRTIHESAGPFEPVNRMPDGKSLLYKEGGSVQRNNKGIPLPPITGGHADGPEYTPDGKHIYYNANPTGTMQIWRMRPDGSGKEQLTFDEYHNWFPHISPDGKWIVFISYPPDIDPNDHPAYQRVTLRLMPAAGGAPRVIAYLYGGGGTLNGPSWSPDSRYIAFVSNF